MRCTQPIMDTLPALQYLHENGCPWIAPRAITPPITNTGTVCSTRWITSAEEWEKYAKEHAEHLR